MTARSWTPVRTLFPSSLLYDLPLSSIREGVGIILPAQRMNIKINASDLTIADLVVHDDCKLSVTGSQCVYVWLRVHICAIVLGKQPTCSILATANDSKAIIC